MKTIAPSTMSSRETPGTANPGPPIYIHSATNMERAERLILDGKAHPSAVTDARRWFRDELAREFGCAWYDSARLTMAEPVQRARALSRTITRMRLAKAEELGWEWDRFAPLGAFIWKKPDGILTEEPPELWEKL